MTKTTLYIVRHGKTMFNTIERVQGWCDTPLTKQGQEGNHYLGKGLKDVDFSFAYSFTVYYNRNTEKNNLFFWLLHKFVLRFSVNSQMFISKIACYTTSRCSHKKTIFNQIWFIDILNGTCIFADCRCKRIEADRPSLKFFNHC